MTKHCRSGVFVAGLAVEALTEARCAEKPHRPFPDHQRLPETGAVELTLATALFGLRRVPEARRQSAAAHGACLASFGPGHRRTVEARTPLERIVGARP